MSLCLCCGPHAVALMRGHGSVAAAAAKTNDALVDRPWALWKQRAMGKT